jgi:diguanylate cyclase (GGDEF)-like protein
VTSLLVLAFVFGILVGGIAGAVIGRRWGAAHAGWRRPADSIAPPSTAEHAYPAEANFEAIAVSLVDRCAARVQLPCALVMRDREGAPATIVAVTDGLDQRLVGMEVPLDTQAGRAILEGVPVVGSPDEPVVQTARRDRRRPVTGGVAVPVGQGARASGAVIAFGVPPAGGGDAVHGLSALVRLFASQLLPAHQVWVAQRRAETDELTGLPNRRAMKAVMSRAGIERAALILLDIDHFKQINDTHGHPAGDAALVHLAKLLKEALRGGDDAARMGGEEFAVWLPGAAPETALEVAERLRAQVERSPFRWQGQELRLTISCGVACYPVPIRAADNLMVTADAALYRLTRVVS